MTSALEASMLPRPAGHQKARARIVVVEDEAVVAMDLEWQLEQMGYQVCARADNAADALACARADRPDLVLMDIVIKGNGDGITAAEAIGALGIPVLYLSAYSDDATVQRAARTGPYGYLTKPFQTRELRAAIEVALYKSDLERKLRESERWFSATLRCVGDAVIATDAEGRVRFMNPMAEQMSGWTADQAIGRAADAVVRIEEASDGSPLDSPVSRALDGDQVVGIEFGSLLVCPDGARLPIDDSAAPIRDAEGNLMGAVMVFRDVRNRLAAENRLRQSEERFRNAFNFAPGGMAVVSLDMRLLQVNEALCELLGSPANELLDETLGRYACVDVADERLRLMDLVAGHHASVEFEKCFQRRDGKQLWTVVSVSLLRQDQEPLCYLYQVHDITERREVENRLAHLAHYDALTGLANRALLTEEIDRAIAAARRHRQRLAVVFIDLDHFKQVNDSLGHEAGDELLKTVAYRLRHAVRDSDLVARLGGDEFVILLPEIETAEDVLVVTEKVQSECARPVLVAGREVRVGASMGVSLYPDDAGDSRSLLRFADSALYHAKSEGRNHLQFYRTELTARIDERLKIGASLRGALERNEFELYYQPIMSVASGMPVGAEALIRWHHPTRGLLGPDVFMPVAEETGISAAIGEWVIRSACREAAAWRDAISVSVNVSASQFRSERLVAVVRAALTEVGLEPSRLCIELTEQLLLADSERNRSLLADLKALGVQIAIDDFGTGYSSLSTISQFRPTELKIDRGLIGRSDEPDGAALVTAAIAMAHSLKLGVVTEGVETQAQHDFLKERGCERAQGYLFAHPAAAATFVDWMTVRHGPAAPAGGVVH